MKLALPLVLASFAVASVPLAAFAQDETPPLPPAQPEPAPPPPQIEVRAQPPAWEAPPPAAETPAPKPPGKPRYDFVRIAMGPRFQYVKSAGFDPFADDDTLTQFSLQGTITLLTAGRFSLAAGAAWDAGGRSSGMRGIETKLETHRFTVPIEGRYHVTPWLYGFARVAPGAAYEFARVSDPSSPNELSDSTWAFATDASAGASFLLAPYGKSDQRLVRFWITPEAGWSITSQASFGPNPGRDDKDVLGSDESTRVHPVALGGFFWRVTAAITF